MNINKLNIRLTFTEPVLGTLSGNIDVTKDFIISKAKTEEQRKEEITLMEAQEDLIKATTYFPKDDKGRFLYDYQIKGFIKEAFGVLIEAGDGKNLTPYVVKRAIDNFVFVSPRRNYLNVVGEPSFCQRPIRVDTMQGPRVALANSEQLQEGTNLEFTVQVIEVTNKKSKAYGLDIEMVQEALKYGAFKGIGQWRNGSFGRFSYEILK